MFLLGLILFVYGWFAAALIALFAWTMVRLHYVLFDRLARRRRARWEQDLT